MIRKLYAFRNTLLTGSNDYNSRVLGDIDSIIDGLELEEYLEQRYDFEKHFESLVISSKVYQDIVDLLENPQEPSEALKNLMIDNKK